MFSEAYIRLGDDTAASVLALIRTGRRMGQEHRMPAQRVESEMFRIIAPSTPHGNRPSLGAVSAASLDELYYSGSMSGWRSTFVFVQQG